MILTKKQEAALKSKEKNYKTVVKQYLQKAEAIRKRPSAVISFLQCKDTVHVLFQSNEWTDGFDDDQGYIGLTNMDASKVELVLKVLYAHGFTYKSERQDQDGDLRIDMQYGEDFYLDLIFKFPAADGTNLPVGCHRVKTGVEKRPIYKIVCEGLEIPQDVEGKTTPPVTTPEVPF